MDTVSGATYSSTGILNAVKLALAKAAVAPAEKTAPEQTASEETAEGTAPSEAAEPGKRRSPRPPWRWCSRRKRAPFPCGSRKYGSNFSLQMHRHPLNRNRHLLRKCCRHPSRHCRRKRPGLNLNGRRARMNTKNFFLPGGEPAANLGVLWQYQQVALIRAAAVSQRKQEIAEVEATMLPFCRRRAQHRQSRAATGTASMRAAPMVLAMSFRCR